MIDSIAFLFSAFWCHLTHRRQGKWFTLDRRALCDCGIAWTEYRDWDDKPYWGVIWPE